MSAKGHPTPASAPAEDAATESLDATTVLRQFRMIFGAVRSHFKDIEKASGIGGAQLWAVGIISERPGIGVTELAHALDIHQSTASNLVRALLERDLIRADRDEADRRSVRLTVRPTGRRALKQAPTPFANVLQVALNQLDAATLKRLRRDLTTLIALLDTDRRSARQLMSDL